LVQSQLTPPRPSDQSFRCHRHGAVELNLLSGFELRCDGVKVRMPQSAERLLAFLAIHDRPLQRSHVAGSLWLDTTDSRSAGSLRSALWRTHRADEHVIEATSGSVGLAAHVRVDLRQGHETARQLLDPLCASAVAAHSIELLDGDLLPDWYADEWLVLPRERWRQVRLHALEVLATRLARQGEYGAAVAAALAAVHGGPLRESAHRCLADVHLAEGNLCEALATYRQFQRLLWTELGLQPSTRFRELVSVAGAVERRDETRVGRG